MTVNYIGQNVRAAKFISDLGEVRNYPLKSWETAANIVDYAYPSGDIRRYGAVGDAAVTFGGAGGVQIIAWTGTTNTTPIQNAINDLQAFSGTYNVNRPALYIPDGAFLTGKLNITLGLLTIKGEGKFNSALCFSDPLGCIVTGAITNAKFDWDGFAILGTVASGVGANFSACVDIIYNAHFSNLYIVAGQQMILGPNGAAQACFFSTLFENVFGTSYNNHGIQANLGPSCTLLNCWSGSQGSLKACYRLTGGITMIGCNGTDWGDYFLIAGNTGSGGAGYNDFISGDSYPYIKLTGCNIESWARTNVAANDAASVNASAIYICSNFQSCNIENSTFVRSLATAYHSLIRYYGQTLHPGGSIVLEDTRLLLAGANPSAAYFYSDLGQSKISIRNVDGNPTPLTNYIAIAAQYYPVIEEKDFNDANGVYDTKKWFTGLGARRLTVEMMRFVATTPATGTTIPDVTGVMQVTTANTGPTTIDRFFFDVSGNSLDIGRNGFLLVNVEDDFTTFKHRGGTVNNALRMRGNRDYVAKKGDMLLFQRGLYNGVNGGWVQIAGDYNREGQMSPDVGNVSRTVVLADKQTQYYNTPLSAPRTATLPVLGASTTAPGLTYRFVRTAAATGASNLTIQDSTAALIKALAVGQWCDVAVNDANTAWILVAAGSL